MDSSPGSIDTRNIVSVCSASGTLDTALLREMLGYFIHENQRRILSLQQAVETGNRESLRQVAHAVRGSASMLGAGRLHDLAWALEMDALSNDLSTLGGAINTLGEELEAVIASLRRAHPEVWTQ